MTSHDYMLELLSGWRRKFTPDELTMLAEQLKQLMGLVKEEKDKMKWEYLQVTLSEDYTWIAFDGVSDCNGDKSILNLLNRLGQDRWEYCTSIGKRYHLLKRSLP